MEILSFAFRFGESLIDTGGHAFIDILSAVHE
jgi:hypothetical protein